MDTRITSMDIKLKRVEPRVLKNGIIVPISLLANTETLQEHQNRIRKEGRTPLNIEEAAVIFPGEEYYS